MSTDTGDLEVLAPAGREVVVGGKTLAVLPLTVGQLPRFARAVWPLAPLFADEETDWLGLVAKHGEALIEAAAVATGMKADELGAIAPDEFVGLASAVFEVNCDFFVRRLAPAFGQASDRIVAAMAGAGPTPSKP